MKVLDCENEETTYSSLEAITGLSKQKFIDFFNTFDLEKYYDEHPNFYGSGNDLLFIKLREMTQGRSLLFDATCWFHLSRTHKDHSFEQGILPLGKAIDSIWSYLFQLQEGVLSREEWSNFQETMGESHTQHAHLYNMKVYNPSLWGPYAMLVRQIAFSASKVGNHDYLDAPEIVEDICFAYQHQYPFDLLRKFKETTNSYIVKFQVPHGNVEHLGIALFYLYKKHHKDKLSLHSNTCYDGKGKAISNEQILKVEQVKLAL